MPTDVVTNAKPFDSLGRIGIVGKLEEHALAHPDQVYTIFTEGEAREFLLCLALVMKDQARVLSKPLVPAPGSAFNPKNFNRTQRNMVLQMANKFRRNAANGNALNFCLEELSHPVLEFKKVQITFGRLQ